GAGLAVARLRVAVRGTRAPRRAAVLVAGFVPLDRGQVQTQRRRRRQGEPVGRTVAGRVGGRRVDRAFHHFEIKAEPAREARAFHRGAEAVAGARARVDDVERDPVVAVVAVAPKERPVRRDDVAGHAETLRAAAGEVGADKGGREDFGRAVGELDVRLPRTGRDGDDACAQAVALHRDVV